MSFWQIPTRPVRSSLMCNESSVAVVEVVEMVDVVVVFGIVEWSVENGWVLGWRKTEFGGWDEKLVWAVVSIKLYCSFDWSNCRRSSCLLDKL